jgi:hypothetical protein
MQRVERSTRRLLGKTDTGATIIIIETRATPIFTPWAGRQQRLSSIVTWCLEDGREVVRDNSGALKIVETGEIIREII